MDAATEQRYEMQLGAEESSGTNRIFVNLRIGKIAQTSNDQLVGFVPAQTKNKDGTINSFYAKPYDKITGYVTDIRWHKHTLKDGTVLSGWNITIDTTKEVFVLGVNKNDRPYQRLMSTLLAVDFEQPVMFVGFMGKDKKDRPQKVLLLSQEMGPDNKPCWIKPIVEEKWLSRLVIDKLKQGLQLTEQEERNVTRTTDGKFNKDYPYIVEGPDGTWSMEVWNNHLFEMMEEHVIPAVEAAAAKRGFAPRQEAASVPDDSLDFTGPANGVRPVEDDDIPF